MFSSNVDIKAILGDFVIEGMMFRYSSFVPRLYNFCKSLGFEPGKILPSRAFCSDENQGYPIILIAKHFGAFPFNHGRVGGVVSTDRHGPFAQHGKDLVLIHASHVGYDPDTHTFGPYRRLQTEFSETGPTCGKIKNVLEWYEHEYAFAKENIFLEHHDEYFMVTIDNQLLRENRPEGLFLNMEKIVLPSNRGEFHPLKSYSTSKCYPASKDFRTLIGDSQWPVSGRRSIGDWLLPELFRFKRAILDDPETYGYLEQNLLNPMSQIVTSKFPLLTAAQVNTEVEFDRTFRTLVKAEGYSGKQVVLISGLNIDISPRDGQFFPLTKFVPWAAFVKQKDGKSYLFEQNELFNQLHNQSENNPDEVDLEAAIQKMENEEEIRIKISG
jgi:hypothetical protein